jgi:hypothetical protein
MMKDTLITKQVIACHPLVRSLGSWERQLICDALLEERRISPAYTLRIWQEDSVLTLAYRGPRFGIEDIAAIKQPPDYPYGSGSAEILSCDGIQHRYLNGTNYWSASSNEEPFFITIPIPLPKNLDVLQLHSFIQDPKLNHVFLTELLGNVHHHVNIAEHGDPDLWVRERLSAARARCARYLN